MSDLPLKATLKAGRDYDAPWLTVDGSDPSDLEFKLSAIIDTQVIDKLIEAANLLKAANNASPILPGGPAAAAPAPVQQQQPAGWGNSAPAAAPAWSQPAAAPAAVGGPQNGSPHPENKPCACGQVLQYKAFTSKAGKSLKMWACPNQRAKGDGHATEWVD